MTAPGQFYLVSDFRFVEIQYECERCKHTWTHSQIENHNGHTAFANSQTWSGWVARGYGKIFYHKKEEIAVCMCHMCFDPAADLDNTTTAMEAREQHDRETMRVQMALRSASRSGVAKRTSSKSSERASRDIDDLMADPAKPAASPAPVDDLFGDL